MMIWSIKRQRPSTTSGVIATVSFIILAVLLTLTEPWFTFFPFLLYNAALAFVFIYRTFWTRLLLAASSMVLWITLTNTRVYHNGILASMTCLVMHHVFFDMAVVEFVSLEKTKSGI